MSLEGPEAICGIALQDKRGPQPGSLSLFFFSFSFDFSLFSSTSAIFRETAFLIRSMSCGAGEILFHAAIQT